MKYKIELYARVKGVQLLKVTEEEKENLLEEDLGDIYMDYIDDHDYDFSLENQYLMDGVDRFGFIVTDEEGNTVYRSDDVEDLLKKDKTYDEDGEYLVKNWEFKGVRDGDYLVRFQTIKGYESEGELELDEPFDPEKLYLVQDIELNDEFAGDYLYPAAAVYYQRGEGYDAERDIVELEFLSDCGEQYWDTWLMNVKNKDWWTDLKEE